MNTTSNMFKMSKNTVVAIIIDSLGSFFKKKCWLVFGTVLWVVYPLFFTQTTIDVSYNSFIFGGVRNSTYYFAKTLLAFRFLLDFLSLSIFMHNTQNITQSLFGSESVMVFFYDQLLVYTLLRVVINNLYWILWWHHFIFLAVHEQRRNSCFFYRLAHIKTERIVLIGAHSIFEYFYAEIQDYLWKIHDLLAVEHCHGLKWAKRGIKNL